MTRSEYRAFFDQVTLPREASLGVPTLSRLSEAVKSLVELCSQVLDLLGGFLRKWLVHKLEAVFQVFKLTPGTVP